MVVAQDGASRAHLSLLIKGRPGSASSRAKRVLLNDCEHVSAFVEFLLNVLQDERQVFR